jgi:hypothetical protein
MPLVGRGRELDRFAELLAGPATAALLIKAARYGKTALLTRAIEMATANWTRVLTAAGSPTERTMPFAGLQQLLYPVRRDIDQRSALPLIMGMDPTPTDQPASQPGRKSRSTALASMSA